MTSPAPRNTIEPAATAEPRRPLLMIGLDAAEWSLIRTWMGEGFLPHLSGLMERGGCATLRPKPDWMVGGLWPSFYTSSTVDRFGMYHYLVWRPDRMATERPNPEWMPLEPFWRHLEAPGCRVIALDVPLCYAPHGSPATEIAGWATHETLRGSGSSPAGLLEEIQREFGRPPFGEEAGFPISSREGLAVRDECVKTAQLVGEVGRTLMQRHPWDLAVICLSSAHRGGHLLWDRTNVTDEGTVGQRDAMARGLRDVYVACDAAVGRLIEQAGERANVMVFALHGMGANQDRTALLPEMLARVLSNRHSEGGSVGKSRITDRLRRRIPGGLRARVKRHLPRAVQDRLTVYWRANRQDWSRTQAFVTFCDLEGYIRINLRGREREGIVSPEEYRPLCERIAAGILSFRDADTGQPLVDEIRFADQTFGDGPMRRHLPDLVVGWMPSAAASHREVTSDRYGSIRWPTPGRNPAGRSGNHRRDGFLIVGGDAFRRRRLADEATVLDLAPTALDLLGLPMPPAFQGKSMLVADS